MLVMHTSQKQEKVQVEVEEAVEEQKEPEPNACLSELSDIKFEAVEERQYHTMGDEEVKGNLTLACSDESSDHDKRIQEYE